MTGGVVGGEQLWGGGLLVEGRIDFNRDGAGLNCRRATHQHSADGTATEVSPTFAPIGLGNEGFESELQSAAFRGSSG